uniref:Uncharacterized protein n=1 Tax=Mycena chlorophos TaxID=658473 RepID=A0ABQ0M6Q8_MYCCL|nr:predicted protein [Mycena chlorophos]
MSSTRPWILSGCAGVVEAPQSRLAARRSQESHKGPGLCDVIAQSIPSLDAQHHRQHHVPTYPPRITQETNPHPAKTNDPADLQGPGSEQTGGLASNPNEAVFHARDPHVPSAQIMASLEQPLSKEELAKRKEELNRK